jgi:hypothetical protein
VSIKNIVVYAVLAVICAGCQSKPQSNAPQPQQPAASAKKADPAQPQYESGRTAFQKLYLGARNWSPDAQPVKIESRPRPGDPHDGTSSVWSGTFASPRLGQTRSFLWSGAIGEDAPEPGITPGGLDTFSAGNINTQPFDIAYLKVDTGKALEVANKKGGAALLKKKKDQPVKYALTWEPGKARLRWHVIYGNSERDAPLHIVVDASTGEFVRTEK